MTDTAACPKERPILFSGAMVNAILAGEKTQTRRVIKRCRLNFRDREARDRAWKTRREKYGPCGHSGAYSHYASTDSCPDCGRMRCFIAKLYREGVLSEGQAAKATGMSRLAIRRLAEIVK